MRLFIGLWFDDDAVSELAGWAHEAHELCGGRIMRSQDMHLTVAFLGLAQPDQIEALVQTVPQWRVNLEPFKLQRFGKFERARVVWAGPDEGQRLPWLYTLYDTLWDRLDDMGWRRPDSPFRPHVSLLRSAGSCDVEALRRDALLVRPQRCVLVASKPDGTGSNYQVLAQLSAT